MESGISFRGFAMFATGRAREMKIKNGSRRLPFECVVVRYDSVDGTNLRGLLALRSILCLELHLLVLLQGLEAAALDLGEVREEVLTTAIRLDEAKALGVVEPLDRTRAHCHSFSPKTRNPPGRGSAKFFRTPSLPE